MFGGYTIQWGRMTLVAALLAGLAATAPVRGAIAQSGSLEPWQTMSGEEQIRLYYLPRARAGDATAQYYLGHMFQNGLGVEQDKRAAAEWYGRAAAQNDPRALYRLGVMLQTGDGVPVDREEALSLYGRAAQQGVLEAYFNMAQMIERGEGTDADPARATAMFEQLANAGMTEAMRELGRISAQSEDRDLTAAWFWFALAAANGDTQAGELARLVAGSLSDEELEKAQQRLGKSLKK